MILTAGLDDSGRRLDRILRKALPRLPLSALNRYLRQNLILVNGSPAGGNERISCGAVIEIRLEQEIPEKTIFSPRQNLKAVSEPEIIPEIILEKAGLLALNKPAGLAVHGYPDSLDLQVQQYLKGKRSPSLSFKPGPLHRLDKPTSGIIVFGLDLIAAKWFSALIKKGKITRRYLALLKGKKNAPERWEDMLYRDKSARKTLIDPSRAGARRAITQLWPLTWTLWNGSFYSLVRLAIETGITHQIRAQAAFHGCPLAGDGKYGGGYGKEIFLHSEEIILPEEATKNPDMKNFPLSLKAPLPEYFSKKIKALFNYNYP